MKKVKYEDFKIGNGKIKKTGFTKLKRTTFNWKKIIRYIFLGELLTLPKGKYTRDTYNKKGLVKRENIEII